MLNYEQRKYRLGTELELGLVTVQKNKIKWRLVSSLPLEMNRL